ncbi:hypothetical protein [Croceivirga thetidis]|uniref:Translation elongation factor EFTu/EF1A C-terminal domain-containing protein n=1 Tax=Croceivirga thetidis TaxID=2721623 RepID=A0ABX1GQC5_9FLAO|nr:hypothetical protein [Croceivirga thetidis]NKI32128.1 hypothetical protein [Croceivirga thetidis]
MIDFEKFRNWHFVATIRYRTPNEGGRKTPCELGYNPDLKFPFTDRMFMARQIWEGIDKVFPGDTVNAKILTASPNLLKNRLSIGLNFTLNEGPVIVADGIITKLGEI